MNQQQQSFKCDQCSSLQGWTDTCRLCSNQKLLPFDLTIPQSVNPLQVPRIQQNDKKRCFSCNKNVGLLGIQCKCCFIFCTFHRLPQSHNCQIDFRQIARLKLRHQQQLNRRRVFQHGHTQCTNCGHWIKKNLLPGHMHSHANLIMEKLLLGDKVCSKNKQQLIIRHKVTHIVNAAIGLRNHFQQKGVKYINLQLQDNHEQQLINEALMAAQFIEQAIKSGGIVFVHCAKGKSRSVSVIIMYLMMYLSMTYEESLQLIKSARPIAKPNRSYERQLKTFYQNILKPK